MQPHANETEAGNVLAHAQAIAEELRAFLNYDEFKFARVDVHPGYLGHGERPSADAVNGYLVELKRAAIRSDVFIFCRFDGTAMMVARGMKVWECRWLEVVPKIRALPTLLERDNEHALK